MFLSQVIANGQTVSWGPTIPAVSSENIHTCFEEGTMTFEFTNASSAMTDVTIEIQLDTGVYYVPSSFSFTASGGISITEDDISDLSRPIFSVSTISSGGQINMTIERTADCEAMAQTISGSTFTDSVHVYDSGVEVTYANGIANGTVNYGILYGLLSITSVNTTPGLINIGSTANRSMTITNGAFGTIDQFYIADVFAAGELDLTNFRINPAGINYSIPPGSISIVGDSVIVSFSATDMMAIDGSGGSVGDGDDLFEDNESFTLSYDVTPTICGASNSISSELLGWFGCSYSDRCQIVNNAATISLNNVSPSLEFSNAITPRLDFCDTVIYSVTLTNVTPESSPAGAAFATDVTAILGLRANRTPIATLADNQQWGSEWRDTRHFVNHTLNGYPVTLPSTPGRTSTTIPYLPPDYFTTDPDGPGGLTDIDGDGYYDDLPKDSSLVISYGVYITPRDGTCTTGRFDYITWEHISADVSWFNNCGDEMSPIRQEMNYTNHIRDYNNSTFINAPSNIVDGENFSVGIQAHLYSAINCNGGHGLTGASMEWITQVVLPPGVNMRAGYDASIYTVTGNVVTRNESYAYSFRNFPLVFDCGLWDGASSISIPISTRYICSSTGVCFEEEMHCFDIEIAPQCPVDCDGVSILNFTTERISESWTNGTQTAVVDLSDPSIVTDYVYPYDTVEFYSEGVFNDTLSDQLFLRINYSPENGGDIFNYEGGSIEIVDLDGQYNSGQTNYNFPLTGAPTINNLGGNDYEMIFDLSSYRTSINPSYNYGQGSGLPGSYDSDTVRIRANMVISNTMSSAGIPYTVDSLSSEFFIENASGDEVICNSWGSELNYEYPNAYASQAYDNLSGCITRRERFFFVYRSQTGDNHPNEYRPTMHLDSAVILVPDGWTVGTVWWIDGAVMNASDYDLKSDGTLTLRRPPGYADFDKQNTSSRSYYVNLTADCQAIDGLNTFSYSNYYKEFAYLTDPTSHVSRVSTDNIGGINYTAPSYSITPINQTVSAYADTVSWRVRVCNTTSDMNVDYNWLSLEDDGNQIIVDSVRDITGGGSSLLNTQVLSSGGTYVELGALNQGACTDIIIYSSYTSCERDTLELSNGWSCLDYPSLTDVNTCSSQNELYILPQAAQISSSITSLADTPIDPSNPSGGDWGSTPIDMCTPFPMELTVINSQPGNLYDASVNFKIPSLGSGLTYVAGSATIEVEGIDLPNTSRPVGAAAESALVSASTSGTPNWIMTLAQLDPTNYGSGAALSGTSNSANNQFILRFELESTCDLISGDFLTVTVDGNDPCGSPANGSSEQIQSYLININGATPPYFSFFTSSINPNNSFEGCNDLKTVSIDVLISGGATSAQDTLEVVLPDGLGYADGYVCNTPGNCPTFASSTIIGGEEVLKFNYPLGATGTIDFTFDIETNSRGDCAPNATISLVNKVVIGGLVCDAVACPSSRVITGSDVLSVSLEKPILSVSYNSLTVFRGNTTNLYYYDMNIANTGLTTENDVIAEFYCLNATGDDIIGGAVARDTITSILANSATTTLAGEFKATCDPDQGLGVLIVPEYENCYCTALESMADKSAGLLEIPHDILANIPPFVCPVVLSNRHVSFRVVRSID